MRNTSRLLKSVLIASFLVTGSASFADERSEAVIETRQGLLKMLGFYIGPMVAMARGQMPYDAEIVRHNASNMATLAPMIPDVFKLDTSGAGIESESLDSIWSNIDDFNAKASALAEKAAALAASADTGESAFRGAFGATGGACKSCHDDYRVQK